VPIETNRVLVKMRPSSALRAAESRANLQPLFDAPAPAASVFGLDATPQWFMAELPEGAASPWDAAHARVADQLGVSEADVVFAEPDMIHDVYVDTNEERTEEGFGATKIECVQNPQDNTRGKPVGPNAIWHLDDQHTQLGSARGAVPFAERRTRIAHIDTGYFPTHITKPEHLLENLGRNFVEGDGATASDPNNERRFFDNSGHGTGTLSILAGRAFGPDPFNIPLGGAPEAAVVPIRVADSVVLLRTSALARALDYAIRTECDVITMSMGGLPTQAWAEAVDRVYEAGIVFCAAGGNRTRPAPPKVLVYPARYPRVIAVVGVMANGQPYKNLDRALEGSFGPDAAMKAALAAYTPNIPWARFGCENFVRLNGEGTSSATPQVAAAAALYIEKHKNVLLRRDWRRVEAVRKALFDSARKGNAEHFGNGILQARAALEIRPDFNRPMAGKSTSSFAFLRLVTGFGITEPTPREEMFNLELAQLWLKSEPLQELIGDPEFRAKFDDRAQQKQMMDIVIQDPRASLALRRHIESRYPVVGGQPPRNALTLGIVASPLAACETEPEPRNPQHRRLRVYASDPSLSTRLATAALNEATLHVRWESWKDREGEYLRFDDVDATGKRYATVDLNDPKLLAQDGWAPAEGNPQFHQQMVYAVAMKTIAHFEKALGRPVLWRPAINPANEFDDSRFVRQLTLRPHALRQANAFYTPGDVSLKFGYFEAEANHPGEHMPGSRVYTCLAHDIIAHETTHAILDGMHPRFTEATNPDVLAFHEAFADIVALLQHFTMREMLENEIARTRGDIETESTLGMLAVQFGQTMAGGRGALRNAIGRFEDGKWVRNEPDPAQLRNTVTSHARGAILVAAVFDAFLAIYKMRTADLLRIYTGGTGVLRAGAIHPDLVRRLADEAAKAADHVLEMAIRALDYLPPIDVTFFEYLRALITADADIVGAGHEYRIAVIEAFRRRGIYPQNFEAGDTPRTLSVDTLRWQGGFDRSQFTLEQLALIRKRYEPILDKLRTYAKDVLYIEDRKELFERTRDHRRELHDQLEAAFQEVPDFARQLGLDFGETFDPAEDKFEVHSLRASMRATPDGGFVPQAVVVLTQSKTIDGGGAGLPKFRGGSTIVVDLIVGDDIKYRIVKNIGNAARQQSTTAFVRSAMADPLRALLIAPAGNESFMALHSLADTV
jgi:Subtilase family